MNLKAFIIGSSDLKLNLPGCANYDKDGNFCMDGNNCKVLEDKRCGYFERAVLPTAKQSGRDHVLDLYSKISSIAFLTKIKEKTCACGTPVSGRNKYCERCKKKRNREYQKNYYHKPKSTSVKVK